MPNTPIRTLSVVILAAGEGTRMRSRRPKILHDVACRPMIVHVLHAAAALTPPVASLSVVVAPNKPEIIDAVTAYHPLIRIVPQDVPRGTGDAVRCALKDRVFTDHDDVLILCGDTPLVQRATLQSLYDAHCTANATLTLAGFYPDVAGAYGRILCTESGNVSAIVEAAEATPEQRAVRLCNAGMMVAKAHVLHTLLERLTPSAVKGEYYLTDAVALAHAQGETCRVVDVPADDVLGVNTRAELADAEAKMQARLRQQALDSGVSMRAPETVLLAADTTFGSDVTLEAHIVFGADVHVGEGTTIRAFSHLEHVRIGAGCTVGPFARLRPGTVLENGVHIGNFVEVKNSHIGTGSKANHLSYLGDSAVGENVNVGAGTITCNYDGVHKSKTVIGSGSFIGSNTALVAPITLGERAWIGAGSVITRDVPTDTLAVTRSTQKHVEGWGKRTKKGD